MSSIDIISVNATSQNEVFWRKALQFINIENLFKIFAATSEQTLQLALFQQ